MKDINDVELRQRCSLSAVHRLIVALITNTRCSRLDPLACITKQFGGSKPLQYSLRNQYINKTSAHRDFYDTPDQRGICELRWDGLMLEGRAGAEGRGLVSLAKNFEECEVLVDALEFTGTV